MSSQLDAVYVLLAFAFVSVTLFFRKKRALGFLRGPPAKSTLLGHEFDLLNAEACTLELEWTKRYGTVFRSAGCYGEQILMVADPRALQHIYEMNYKYPRSKDNQRAFKKLLGRGILWAEGDDHSRHRKTLNPAFSAAQSRGFLPLFQSCTDRLQSRWEAALQGETKVINVYDWLSRLTLDIIGEGAFNYRFGALDNKSDDFSHILETLFTDTKMPTERTILFRAFRRSMPNWIGDLCDYYSTWFPSKEDARFANFQKFSKGIARGLLDEHMAASADYAAKKDILSLLARSPAIDDPKKKMDEDEVLSQMATVILAGHDTTAASIAWILYELAKRPEEQAKVWEEIAHVRSLNHGELTPADYDSMPFLNAIIKEGLRYHAISPLLYRNSGVDDVIPLSQPITSSSGDVITEVPVRKGQRIIFCIGSYNRLPEVWGADADSWNPARFLTLNQKKQIPVGLYGNTLTFSAGVKGCIGWNFAVLEMQAVLFQLMESFEFSMPPGVEVMRIMGAIMVPMIKDKLQEGIKMPLLTKSRK
ncbi:hypothetical protein PC9H_005878 [Pleurotus ostreatus]|uniref:Cytochrome P450 n=1 Tax=Pleurotus ostreatus TaxID=5322 RepID=A0A8H6ZV64_PLEOS|nr:uncharacterized protein PC9H_005878 [Pleurotus ostreatus]KAF7430178.1 hypothetical protein PC9H_005878 [Pleurotus ostreatus]